MQRPTSSSRPCVLAFLFAATVTGCAGGEPLNGEPADAATELGVRVDPIVGEVFVDVVDPDGTPVEPNAVWLTIDGHDTAEGLCMPGVDGEDDCLTWVAEYAAMEQVTIWTDVCGLLFLDPLNVEPAPGFGRAARAKHVTVTANVVGCGAARTPPAQ